MLYSFSSLTIQFIIPSLTVACAYLKVYFVFQASSQKILDRNSSSKTIQTFHRRRRTNIILTLMSSVFFISWAPLNIFQSLMNIHNPFTVSCKLLLFLTAFSITSIFFIFSFSLSHKLWQYLEFATWLEWALCVQVLYSTDILTKTSDRDIEGKHKFIWPAS